MPRTLQASSRPWSNALMRDAACSLPIAQDSRVVAFASEFGCRAPAHLKATGVVVHRDVGVGDEAHGSCIDSDDRDASRSGTLKRRNRALCFDRGNQDDVDFLCDQVLKVADLGVDVELAVLVDELHSKVIGAPLGALKDGIEQWMVEAHHGETYRDVLILLRADSSSRADHGHERNCHGDCSKLFISSSLFPPLCGPRGNRDAHRVTENSSYACLLVARQDGRR